MRVLLGADTLDALDAFVFERRFCPGREPAGRELTVSRLCELMVRACAGALARELADERAGDTGRLALLSTPTGANPRRMSVEFDRGLCFELDMTSVSTRTARARRDLVAACVTAMTCALSTPGAHALDEPELLALFTSHLPTPKPVADRAPERALDVPDPRARSHAHSGAKTPKVSGVGLCAIPAGTR
jgi:hypothetical protein